LCQSERISDNRYKPVKQWLAGSARNDLPSTLAHTSGGMDDVLFDIEVEQLYLLKHEFCILLASLERLPGSP